MKCENCIHYECCSDWCSKEALKDLEMYENCDHYKDKSLCVELPCNWNEYLYVTPTGVDKPLKTKLLAIGIDEDGEIVYNPNEYPRGVFGIGGGKLGENLFIDEKQAEANLKEIEK